MLEVVEEEGILILEDAPYLYINYAKPSERPRPFVSLAPDRTIHLFTGSKIGFPGPRVGFIVSNVDARDRRRRAGADLPTCCSPRRAPICCFRIPKRCAVSRRCCTTTRCSLRKSLWAGGEREARDLSRQPTHRARRVAERTRRVSGVVQLDASRSRILHGVHVPAIRTVTTDDAFIARLVSQYGVVAIPMYDFYPRDARQRNPRAGLDQLRLSFCFSESTGAQRRTDLREAVAAFARAARIESGVATTVTAVKRICVFAGSSIGARRQLIERAAVELGDALAERDIELVYGGGCVGLMGVLADAMLARGGRVIGVIPQTLMVREVGHRGLTELHVVESMHERKATMAALSDGFIALPGGFGTLEELFEMLTWAQLGLHGHPCGLLNVAGYFDALLAFLDHARGRGVRARGASRDAAGRRFAAPTARSLRGVSRAGRRKNGCSAARRRERNAMEMILVVTTGGTIDKVYFDAQERIRSGPLDGRRSVARSARACAIRDDRSHSQRQPRSDRRRSRGDPTRHRRGAERPRRRHARHRHDDGDRARAAARSAARRSC